MSPPDVIIADDHPLFRSALKQAVSAALPEVAIHEADGMDSLEALSEKLPEADLVLLDLKMPGARGFSSLLYLRSQYPVIPVVVVSAVETATVIRKARDFGATGFIPKSSSIEVIASAIKQVLAGELHFPNLDDEPSNGDEDLADKITKLTPQQFRVLMLLVDGLLNKQIAFQLSISEATVKAHMTAIMKKLGLYSRTQAALIAQRLDVSEPGIDDDMDQTNQD